MKRMLLLWLAFFPALTVVAQKPPAKNEYLWGMNYLKAGQNDEAIVCFYKAARRGNADAQYRLGLMYRDGVATEQDYPGAVRLFRKAARQQHAEACRALAVLLYAGAEGVPQDRAAAARCYEWLAGRGDSAALFMLGGMSEYGDGVPQNRAAAVDYYSRAAARGHAEAAFALAFLYEQADSLDRGEHYYAQAADSGLTDAAFNLALLLLRPDYRPDVPRAVALLRRAAEGGSAEAQNNLASLLEAGESVRRDLPEAFRLYTMAAQQNLPQAQHNLGRFYEQGLVAETDARKALELYSRAAAQGLRAAQLSLARLYENGAPGVPAHPQKASYWRQKAGKE